MKNLTLPIITLLLLLTSCTSIPDDISYEAYETASYKARVEHVDDTIKRDKAQKKVNLRYLGVNENTYDAFIDIYEIEMDSLQTIKDSLQVLQDSLSAIHLKEMYLSYDDPNRMPRSELVDLAQEITNYNTEQMEMLPYMIVAGEFVYKANGYEPLSAEAYDLIREDLAAY